MKQALFLMVLSCPAVSLVTAQDPVKTIPKNYKVAEVDFSGAVSRDGRFLSYVDWSTGDLAIRDLKTGENRRLTNKGSWLESNEFANNSTISPESTQVAYAWLNKDGFWDLRVIGLDGSEPRILYRNEEISAIWPKDWSPGGKHILATFFRKDGINQIVLVSVADGSVRVLKTLDWMPVTGDPLEISISPDGRYIVYDLPPQEGSPERDILLLPTDGSLEIPLVQHAANDFLLGWTPDGKRVLFASDRTGTWGVWVIEVADGKPRRAPELVKPDIGPIMGGLGFTRDGSYYYGVDAGVNDVYLTTLDPATDKLQSPIKLVSHVGFDTSVEWSPDGQYLAYVWGSGGGPSPFVLGVRSVATGEERELPLKLSRFHAMQPRWSPDGRSLLAQGRNYKGREGLYRIDAQTGGVTAIVQTETTSVFTISDFIEWPVWSPDGKVISTRWISKGRTIVARGA